MAKAKYTPGKDGRFQTKVWDGTYNPDGRKHYIPIYSTKSSGDLEKKVNAMKAAVADRKYVTPTDETFLTYARSWLTVYKKVRQLNTQRMYENIIEKHLVSYQQRTGNAKDLSTNRPDFSTNSEKCDSG